MFEKSRQKMNDIHYVIEGSTGSKIIYTHCGCDKCYQRRPDQSIFNEICIPGNQHLKSNLIRPCSVYIRRLNLLGHNGSTISNCCLTFPEMNISKESVVSNKKVYKIEPSDSLAENGIENLSDGNSSSVRTTTDLLYKSLCETFSLLRAKEKKCKETRKTDSNKFSSCNSRKIGIKNTSKDLNGDWHQTKNRITKTSNISKPRVINSSHYCKISYFPTSKSAIKNFDERENLNINKFNRNSYEGTDSEAENEAPLEIDIKNMPSSSEAYTNHRTKACRIPNIDSGLFVDRGNKYNFSFQGSTPEIFSRFQVKSNQDKALQTHDLLFALNNPNSYCASNSKTKGFEKAENVFDKNGKVEIEMVEEHIVQKNVKGIAKKYSVGKDVELVSENSVYVSNHKIKSIEKINNGVENSDGENQITGEYIISRNFEETTKKYPVMNEALIIEKSHKNEKYLEDDDNVGNKQMLKEVVKPCSVFIKPIDEETIKMYCNSSLTVVRDEASSCIPQIKNVNRSEIDSCLSSSNFCIPLETTDKISNRSTIGKFNTMKKQILKFTRRIPLIKPCSVVIDKLSPTVINSCYNENAPYNVMNETENYISKEKSVSQFKMNFFSPPNHTISSQINGETSNIKSVSKFAVNTEQGIKKPKETPLFEPCNVVIQKVSVGEERSITKRSMKKQNNFLKFKRKNNFMAFKRKKPWVFLKKNILIKCIINKMHAKKLGKPFVFKKLKKEPKILKQTAKECEKDLQVKEDFNVNDCINVDKVSSTLLRKNQQICYTSPKCLLSNLKSDNCSVLLNKVNVEDLNVNNCRNVEKVSSRSTKIHIEHICNTSPSILPTCSSSNLVVKDCFVHLERRDVDECLVENKKLFNNQYGSKCNTSSDILLHCPVSNFRIHDCSVLLKRINLDEYLAENRNVDQYDFGNESEYFIGSKHGTRSKHNRYKTDENFVQNSRLRLKRGCALTAKYTSSLHAKKLKRITDNHRNLICDSEYKCVQCRKSITTDVELYHHLCIGKRKKGYICDICEKIFETIPGLKKHLNYHYKFIR